jgi:hypothetical protein
MENRVFFPQSALDQWIVDGSVDLVDGELTILGVGRRYRLVEAVRIVRDVTGGTDPHELVGRVKGRAYLEQLGAELVETSMLIGDSAYDVEPGWAGVPAGSYAEYLASDAHKRARAAAAGRDAKSKGEPKSDEELLARFAAGTL